MSGEKGSSRRCRRCASAQQLGPGERPRGLVACPTETATTLITWYDDLYFSFQQDWVHIYLQRMAT